jgi:hypothetical protein
MNNLNNLLKSKEPIILYNLNSSNKLSLSNNLSLSKNYLLKYKTVQPNSLYECFIGKIKSSSNINNIIFSPQFSKKKEEESFKRIKDTDTDTGIRFSIDSVDIYELSNDNINKISKTILPQGIHGNKRDFLIISFNEEEANYTNSKTGALINKIETQNPSIIFVCTQESGSGNTHFQHIFKNRLEHIGYEQKEKADASYSIAHTAILIREKNRNCRTRVFCKKSEKSVTINQPLYSKKIGVESGNLKTIFKGSILIKLTYTKNGKEYKFAVVNSHLSFTDKENTYLGKRKKQFFDIVEEFDLQQLYNLGYNIFFCGDLNFRLFKGKLTDNRKLNNSKLTIPNEILGYVKSNGIINITKTKNNDRIKNELYELLGEKPENNLLEEFKKSLDIIKFPLTCAFKQKRYQNRYDSYTTTKSNKELAFENDPGQIDIFKCNSNKGNVQCIKIKKKFLSEKKTRRDPSNCDKILFALHNLTTDDKFFMPKFPDDSDHKLISLSGNFIE